MIFISFLAFLLYKLYCFCFLYYGYIDKTYGKRNINLYSKIPYMDSPIDIISANMDNVNKNISIFV